MTLSNLPTLAEAQTATARIATATDGAVFCKQKHISYWLRCLRSPLPHQYTSNDSNRMTLAFFILSALDLLGVLHSRTSHDERRAYADWIYKCQHPDGGFRAFPGTDFGARGDAQNKVWDPSNLPATYFALASLAVLEDDMQRVRRAACLEWLRRMQRPDGSFGQTLGEGGSIEGGMDTRFGYCAMGVRWILRGDVEGSVDGVQDVDTEKLIRCIRESETYDGGISEEPFHEAHAGFTYCAIGALAFIGTPTNPQTRRDAAPERRGLSSPEKTIRWLMSRLTTLVEQDQLEDGDYAGYEDFSTDDTTSTGQTPNSSFSSNADPSSEAKVSHRSFQNVSRATAQKASVSDLPAQEENTLDGAIATDTGASHCDDDLWLHDRVQWAGFNGRANKVADTCYAFWVGGSLSILNSLHLVDPGPVRRHLLEKTQHFLMGGFGKNAGDLPDIFHSYLGLAALSLLGLDDGSAPRCGTAPDDDGGQDEQATRESGLLALDPTLCLSVRGRRWIESLKWREDCGSG